MKIMLQIGGRKMPVWMTSFSGFIRKCSSTIRFDAKKIRNGKEKKAVSATIMLLVYTCMTSNIGCHLRRLLLELFNGLLGGLGGIAGTNTIRSTKSHAITTWKTCIYLIENQACQSSVHRSCLVRKYSGKMTTTCQHELHYSIFI